MDRIYIEFFRKLMQNADNLSTYVASLYSGDEYSQSDLNEIFGVLKKEGLVSCSYADNKVWGLAITFKGKRFFDGKMLRIAKLIDSIDEIEGLFHIPQTIGAPHEETIHDVQEYQDWVQEISIELNEIYTRTRDRYIWDTINALKRNMTGWNDRKVFAENKSMLRAIRKNIDRYYPDLDKDTNVKEQIMKEKTPMIFISHSSKDVKYVEQIMLLLESMGLDQTQVFCSSLPGYGIPLDKSIFDYLRQLFEEHTLHVLFVHSENYYQSPVSLNEMGAAWVLRNDVTSILLPGFEFGQMKGVVNNQTISIKLDMPLLELQDKLNQLYSKIVEEFGLTKKTDIIWQQKRDAFIQNTKRISEIEDGEMISQDAALVINEAARETNGTIMKSEDLSGNLTIQAGNTVMYSGSSQQERVRWFAALDELIDVGYVKQADNKGMLFQITEAGYKYLDKNWVVQEI